MSLNQQQIKTALAASASGVVKKSAGDGLYFVAKRGKGFWVYQYWDTLEGDTSRKGTRSKGLGPLADLPTYGHAKDARDAFRLGHADGRAAAIETAKSGPTFQGAAEAFLRQQEPTWGQKRYVNARSLLLGHKGRVSPAAPLFALRVSAITPDMVANVLRPIWTGPGNTVGNNLRSLIERSINGHAGPNGNPASWDVLQAPRFNLAIVPALRKAHPAMPLSDVGAWYRSLDWQGNPEHRAIAFYVLTGGAGRREAIVEATWKEIDVQAAAWTIPGEHLKEGKRALRANEKPTDLPIPLTAEALAVLGEPGEPDALVFTNKHGRQFTNGTLSLKVLFGFQGKDDAEPYADLHGLRGTFRSFAQVPANGIPFAVAEHLLSHGVQNKDDTGRRVGNQVSAYLRYDFDAEKRTALEKWATFLTAGNKVAAVA